MNEDDLVTAIAKDANLTKVDAEHALNATISAITGALAKGDKVTLVGFGTFEVRERAEREGRNPQTGAPLKIEAKRIAVWIAGKTVNKAVAK